MFSYMERTISIERIEEILVCTRITRDYNLYMEEAPEVLNITKLPRGYIVVILC